MSNKKFPKVTLCLLGIELLYSHSSFKVNTLLDYLSKQSTSLEFIKPKNINRENFFIKCFNCMFSSLNYKEYILSLSSTAILCTLFERSFGSFTLLKAVGYCFIGTVLCMLPSTTRLYFDSNDDAYNSQIFNLPILCFSSLFFNGQFSLFTNLLLTCGILYYYFKYDSVYDLRTGLFFSLFMQRYIKRSIAFSQELSFIRNLKSNKI